MTPFNRQFIACNEDGTCQHMDLERYNLMPEDEQQRYAKMVRPDFYGPYGPMFCSAAPGICSGKHCPKLKP